MVTEAYRIRHELASDAGGIYQIFVCGKNVVWDFMSRQLLTRIVLLKVKDLQ